MSLRRIISVTLVTLSLSIAAAGCSSPVPSYGDLDREPTTDHPLPADISDDRLEGVDRDSIRWVGRYNGTDLWLAAGENNYDACLVTYTDSTNGLVACGGGLMQSTTSAGLEFAVVPDGNPAPAGFEAVSQNVFASS
jgi:hypothetical protein